MRDAAAAQSGSAKTNFARSSLILFLPDVNILVWQTRRKMRELAAFLNLPPPVSLSLSPYLAGSIKPRICWQPTLLLLLLAIAVSFALSATCAATGAELFYAHNVLFVPIPNTLRTCRTILPPPLSLFSFLAKPYITLHRPTNLSLRLLLSLRSAFS